MSKYFQARWQLKDLVLVLTVTILLLVLVDAAIYYSGLRDYYANLIATGEGAWVKELIILGLYFIQSIILLIPLSVLVIKKYKWKWKEFGFNRFKPFQHLGLALLGYLFYVGVSLMIAALIVFGGIKIPGYQIPEPTLPLFGETGLAITIAAIVIIGIAPILEELFFRGFILQGLVNKIGPYFGAVLTALLFAIVHLQFASFIPIFILSLILSILFIRSKSIWPCIIFHLINNAVAFMIELLMIKGVIPLDF
jgi:uncharacterized protein